jgi:hypothetical protein
MSLRTGTLCLTVQRMNTQIDSSKLAVDIREAARKISVSPRTIQNYIQAGILPSRKIGRRTVVLIRDLEHFLRSDKRSLRPGDPDERTGGNSRTRLRSARD